MKMDDYVLLVKLYEIGSIRKAAKEIMISQPAVSQRLKYIETYFGVQIFIRSQKRLTATPSGEIILRHARNVLEAECRLKNELAASSDEVQGTLSIACSSVVSQRFLPRILAQFTKTYPKVSIDLVTGLSETIKKDSKSSHVRIIRGERIKEDTSIRLFQDPLYIFDTEPFPETSLKKRPLISFKSGDSMNEIVDDWLYHHQSQIQPVEMIRVDQIETCKQFMKAGLGMAVLPKSVAHSLLGDYPHLPLKHNGEALARDTWVCFQEDIRKLPQVDRFIDLVQETSFE